MAITVVNTTNVKALTEKAVDSVAFWTFAAAQWHRLYYDWVPMVTGNLADDVEIRAAEIEHTSIYAGPQYRGAVNGWPIVNRTRDRHPLASSKWDEAAAPTQLPKLEETLEDYLNKKVVTG